MTQATATQRQSVTPALHAGALAAEALDNFVATHNLIDLHDDGTPSATVAQIAIFIPGVSGAQVFDLTETTARLLESSISPVTRVAQHQLATRTARRNRRRHLTATR